MVRNRNRVRFQPTDIVVFTHHGRRETKPRVAVVLAVEGDHSLIVLWGTSKKQGFGSVPMVVGDPADYRCETLELRTTTYFYASNIAAININRSEARRTQRRCNKLFFLDLKKVAENTQKKMTEATKAHLEQHGSLPEEGLHADGLHPPPWKEQPVAEEMPEQHDTPADSALATSAAHEAEVIVANAGEVKPPEQA